MDVPIKTGDDQVLERDAEHGILHAYEDTSSLGKDDILQLEHTDPVLNAKMHVVNNAIDEASRMAHVLPSFLRKDANSVRSQIGFTTYQWKVPQFQGTFLLLKIHY